MYSVVLPEGFEKLGSCAFINCNSMRYVDIPSTLNYIGDSAFGDCKKLRMLILPNNVGYIGDGAFYGCNVLTVFCPDKSFTAVRLIDMEIPIELYQAFEEDDSEKLLTEGESYYVANTLAAMANGYVSLDLGYSFKDGNTLGMNSPTLKIRIPSGIELLEKTIMLDGIRLAGEDYEYEDSVLTIRLNNTSGKLVFNITPQTDKKIATYALLTFTKIDGGKYEEIIGIVNENISTLSLETDNEVCTPNIHVKGVGPSESDIMLYIDGQLINTVRSNKSGSFDATITIAEPKNYNSYLVTAKATDDDGNHISSSRVVRYCLEAPAVKSFFMTYNGMDYNMVQQGTLKPTISFVPGAAFRFEVGMTNSDRVDKMFICSTRSNVTKRLEAVYDKNAGVFIAEGLFDPYDTGYVPGNISIEYSLVRDKMNFGMSNVDFSDEKYINGVSSQIKEAITGDLGDKIENIYTDDNTISGNIRLEDMDTLISYSIDKCEIPDGYTAVKATEDGYEAVTDDYGNMIYLKLTETSSDKLSGEYIDFASGKSVRFNLAGDYITESEEKNTFSFSEKFGYSDRLVTWDNRQIDLNEAKQAVMSANIPENQKARLMASIGSVRRMSDGIAGTYAFSVIMKSSGTQHTLLSSLLFNLLSVYSLCCADDVLSMVPYLLSSEKKGRPVVFRWIIDPSGYVYDSETDERIGGVTVTAYWIPSDESDSFFETVPSENEYGEIWDASEWDQINPLISDESGCYAWDVPEGWWRVKYEKEGYETTWSDWLPVPPPQTNVNIGLKKAETTVIYGDVNGDKVVNAKDVTTLRRHLAGGWDVVIVTSNSDVNNDGVINAKDVTILRRYLAGGWGIELPMLNSAGDGSTAVAEMNYFNDRLEIDDCYAGTISFSFTAEGTDHTLNFDFFYEDDYNMSLGVSEDSFGEFVYAGNVTMLDLSNIDSESLMKTLLDPFYFNNLVMQFRNVTAVKIDSGDMSFLPASGLLNYSEKPITIINA